MIKEFFIGELSKIESDWKRLEAGSEMTSFQSYDWSLLLLKDIKEKLLRSIFWKPVFICHFNDDGKIDMIAPLVVQSRSVNLRFYSMTSGICILGEKSYSDYLNFIYDGWSDEAADEIFGFLHDNYGELELRFNNVPGKLFAREIYFRPFQASQQRRRDRRIRQKPRRRRRILQISLQEHAAEHQNRLQQAGEKRL